MIGSKNAASIGQSGLNVTPNTGFMFAPFVGLVGCTPIVQRKRADAQQGESTKCGGVCVFHAKNFCASEPLNATQLIGEVL